MTKKGRNVYTVSFGGVRSLFTGKVEIWADSIDEAIKNVRKEIPNCGEINGVRFGRG